MVRHYPPRRIGERALRHAGDTMGLVNSESDRIGLQTYPMLVPRSLAVLAASTLAGWAHRLFVLPWIAAHVSRSLLELWFRLVATVILGMIVLSLMGIVV